MNVFVLCTGRSGSLSFASACKHFVNYSSAHESPAGVIGQERLSFPRDHIEVDNHLAMQLGLLEERYGDQAYYVHLTRNRENVAKSFVRLIDSPFSPVRAFATGVLMKPNLTPDEYLEASFAYIDTVNANIMAFLRNKTRKSHVDIDNPTNAFRLFAREIRAEGDMDRAILALTTPSNLKLNARYLRKSSIIRRLIKLPIKS